jgi:hypothetical protein
LRYKGGRRINWRISVAATPGNRKSEVADMIDEESDWLSVDAAVALVETTLQCYREKAVDLVQQAVNNLKVKSKTVNSSPRWLVSDMANGSNSFG